MARFAKGLAQYPRCYCAFCRTFALGNISELGARRVLTYHNSKYALANHSWTEPLDSIYANAQGKSWQLLIPRIGE